MAYRHPSMNNVAHTRDGLIRVLMFDCSNQIRDKDEPSLYSAFRNASPRRQKRIEFSLESAALSKFHRRGIRAGDAMYDLVIEEKSLVTGTVDHQSNGLCNT